MARILFGWEFGENLGHLATLTPIAKALADEGHTVTFAARDLGLAVERVQSAGIQATFFQAPYWLRPRLPSPTLVTFSDVLVNMGFFDANRLRAAFRGWQAILAAVQPDLVVSECATLLRLAAAKRCPVVSVGVGYNVPPQRAPLPSMRPWAPHVPALSVQNEQRVLDVLRSVTAQEDALVPDAIKDLWAPPAIVCSLPELDIYAAHRDGNVVAGPLFPLRRRGGPPRASGERPFVYLGFEHPWLPQVLIALEAHAPSAEVFVRGMPSALLRELPARFPRLTFHAEPVGMTTIAERCSALVHHGGQNSASDGLQIGLPQLILPTSPEQAINAQLLIVLGVALGGPMPGAQPDAFALALDESLTAFLGADRLALNAGRVADAIAARPTLRGLPLVIERVRALLD